MLEVWREYYEKLLNEKFMWRRDGLETLAPTEGPCEQLTWEEVRNARTRSIWRRMVSNWTFEGGDGYVEMLW